MLIMSLGWVDWKTMIKDEKDSQLTGETWISVVVVVTFTINYWPVLIVLVNNHHSQSN